MEDRMSGFCFTKPGNVRGGSGGGCGGGGGGSTGTKCGRWNPTYEQVKVLTDLFRSGLRTPSTDQIQKISSQLSFYGKIESKNVFYWFQNHKARERQKCRRVSVDDHHNKDHLIRRQDSCTLSSSTRYFAEINQVTEQERVIETLQLFPINTFNEVEAEKFRYQANEWKENTTFSCTFNREMDHPPLDLRLSFL